MQHKCTIYNTIISKFECSQIKIYQYIIINTEHNTKISIFADFQIKVYKHMFKNAYIQYQYFNIQILTNKISQYRFAIIIYITLAHTINQQYLIKNTAYTVNFVKCYSNHAF